MRWCVCRCQVKDLAYRNEFRNSGRQWFAWIPCLQRTKTESKANNWGRRWILIVTIKEHEFFMTYLIGSTVGMSCWYNLAFLCLRIYDSPTVEHVIVPSFVPGIGLPLLYLLTSKGLWFHLIHFVSNNTFCSFTYWYSQSILSTYSLCSSNTGYVDEQDI